MDVHKDTISIAVMNSAGKVGMESVVETKAVTILKVIQGLRGNLLVTLEEGTWAAWLYDLLRPHVTKVTFILDHCGIPQVKERIMHPWRDHIREVSRFPNVSCKISGLLSTADPEDGRLTTFAHLLNTLLSALGGTE